MKILIATIGKITDINEKNLINDYLKRITWDVQIKELEIKRSRDFNNDKKLEGSLLLDTVPPAYQKIVLDERGGNIDSFNFAKLFSSSRIAFMIGGAYGHGEDVREKADRLIAMGKMTISHRLCRILLVEQIYRSYSIIKNHPYNK